MFWQILTMVELACWGVCFWWMHRISVRQDTMLAELKEQTQRIERVSQEEHRILTELHPTVQKMERDLGEVAVNTSEPDDISR